MKSSKSLSYLTSTLSLNPATRSRAGVTTARYVPRHKTAAVLVQRKRTNSLHSTAFPQHQAPPAPASTHPQSPPFPPTMRNLNINEPNYDFAQSSSSSSPSIPKASPTTYAANQQLQHATAITTTEKATLFTPTFSTPRPPQSLPAFFGAAAPIAGRSNLVLRNGAYGIPKASLVYETSSKGKGKELPDPVLDNDTPLSIGIGEDAYFLRNDALGVADGVGGWSGHAGANPARWSQKLMQHCSAELARYEDVEDELFLQYYEVDPIQVLQRAFEKSLAECKDEGVIGSSTALLAVLRHDELRVANMGDCCCSIIRGSDYIFRSEEQQHSFNFPVQAGTNSRDTPIKDAQRFNIKVQKDDIVILSSDGLVDNLFDEDILEEVLRFVNSSPQPIPTVASPSSGSRFNLARFSPELVSEALCLRAKSVYEDPRAVSSPFQVRASEEGIHFAGGKRDDVSVLIGVIA